MNNSIQKHLSAALSDGRKRSLFLATCEANRQGQSREKIMATLGKKSIETDKLDVKTVTAIIADTTSRYASERGAHHGQIRGRIVDSFDEQELVLALTPVPLPAPSGNPVGDLLQFLEALYRPGDVIGVNTWPELNQESQRHYPTKATKYPVEKVIETIRQQNDVGALLDKNSSGMMLAGRGAFVVTNPLNPFHGAHSDRDVLDHRYTVIESDNMPLELQYAMFRELDLPLATLTHSGGKSLHGIVRVNAGRNWKLYAKRVAFLHEVLDKALVRVDGACKNAARWTRLPGFHRKEEGVDTDQHLIATNIGAPSWEAWEAAILKLLHHYPEAVSVQTLATPPVPLPELVSGILRERGKMLISAPAKAGKSMLLIQLANALSTCTPWIGFSCAKSRVLYVNLEISAASSINRVIESARAMSLDLNQTEGPFVLNYDASSPSLDSMIKNIVDQAKKLRVDVIIVDPIYSLFGDETNAGEVKKLCRALSLIGTATGAAVIFCHHFNKNISGVNQANHVDKVAGSAVFGRYPDATMTFDRHSKDISMARFDLREFPNPEQFSILFDYPIFRRVDGSIAGTGTQPPVSPGLKGRKPKVTDEQFRDYLDKNPGATPKTVAAALGISPSGAYDRLAKLKKAILVTNPAPTAGPDIENQEIPMLEAEPDEEIIPEEGQEPDIDPVPGRPEQDVPSSSFGPPDAPQDNDAAADNISEHHERLEEVRKQIPTFETPEERQKRELMDDPTAFV